MSAAMIVVEGTSAVRRAGAVAVVTKAVGTESAPAIHVAAMMSAEVTAPEVTDPGMIAGATAEMVIGPGGIMAEAIVLMAIVGTTPVETATVGRTGGGTTVGRRAGATIVGRRAGAMIAAVTIAAVTIAGVALAVAAPKAPRAPG